MDSYVSNKFLFWIRHKRYPFLYWIRSRRSHLLNVSQIFNTTSYGKWWIPIRLISSSFRSNLSESSFRVLSSVIPYSSIPYTLIEYFHWIMIDIQQAGKYVPQNYLYTG